MSLYVWPPVSLASSPVQFIKDGVNTSVEHDTGTPASSEPMPVIEIDSNGNSVTDGLAMVEGGDIVDSSILNNPAYMTVRTLAQDIKKIRIVYNGGTEIEIAINAVTVGIIAPGEKDTLDFKASTGDDIDLRTVAGVGLPGTVYINYFG